ncbi:uncharacterized protein At3g49140 [Vicia villosa]|uniref:uncharacterized protein At3g49140 n=1 Tax=Vicia villosa TaxID=3911 RepID=UPI00273B6853|nr:uncharacterized protein At3g49140 [Vicia villosa]
MTIVAASSSLPFSSASEGICYPLTYGVTCNSIKYPIDGRRVHDLTNTRCKSTFFGSPRFLWLSTEHHFLSKICVAADYSDSISDPYHPLEKLKVSNDVPPARLSSAEIARTTIEAANDALLIFPGMVHSERHEQISWAESQFVIDVDGEIYFRIFDDENLLADRGAYNPVNALFGMDIPMYDNTRIVSEYDIFYGGITDPFLIDDNFIEVPDFEEFNALENPIYFSKCLEKAINRECEKRMSHPSNGVSILGNLVPAYADEEFYKRLIINTSDGHGYMSDLEGFFPNRVNDERETNFKFYKLEIEKIMLNCVYGSQSEISLLKFEDAEPDIFAHTSWGLLKLFNGKYHDALQAFCKKKGLDAEEAHLIGLDSLGVDVRVFSGKEVKTHRFSFKVQAKSEDMAVKQIEKLLYTPSRRKKNMQQSRRGIKKQT